MINIINGHNDNNDKYYKRKKYIIFLEINNIKLNNLIKLVLPARIMMIIFIALTMIITDITRIINTEIINIKKNNTGVLKLTNSFINNVYATESVISEPGWYEIKTSLIEPGFIKTDDSNNISSGKFRFMIKPLIKGEFEFIAKLKDPPPAISITGSGKHIIKTSKNNPGYIDFEFKAHKPFHETIIIEFSTKYPADALIKEIKDKYDAQITEVKKLIKTISEKPLIYSATLPVKLIITKEQCALDPDIYFELCQRNDYFSPAPSLSTAEAEIKMTNFKEKYAGIFNMDEDGFKRFIERTECRFLDDTADYFKGAHTFYYNKGINFTDGSTLKEASDECAFHAPLTAPLNTSLDINRNGYVKLFKFINIYLKYIKKTETGNAKNEYIKYTSKNYSSFDIKAPLYIMAFYNLYYSDSIDALNRTLKIDKKNTAKKIIEDYEFFYNSFIKSGLNYNNYFSEQAGGYFYYNLAKMLKRTGEIDYKRYLLKIKFNNKFLMTDF